MRYLKTWEAEKLLSTPYNTPLGNRDRLFLRLLLGSGLRRAEALAVRPCDLNLVDGELKVVRGKGGKSRVIPFDRNLIKDLLAYSEYYHIGESDSIFPFSLSWASHMVKKYAERAGLKDVHTHTLRHTFAIESLKAGRMLNTIQYDLGHSTIAITGIYLQIMTEDRQRDHIAKPLPWEKEPKTEEGQ